MSCVHPSRYGWPFRSSNCDLMWVKLYSPLGSIRSVLTWACSFSSLMSLLFFYEFVWEGDDEQGFCAIVDAVDDFSEYGFD